MRRSRPVGRPRKKPSLIRAHKNQNTKTPIEGKQRQEAGVASLPNLHAPALIDKVSRMSRNKVSRMSWNLTLQLANARLRAHFSGAAYFFASTLGLSSAFKSPSAYCRSEERRVGKAGRSRW